MLNGPAGIALPCGGDAYWFSVLFSCYNIQCVVHFGVGRTLLIMFLMFSIWCMAQVVWRECALLMMRNMWSVEK